MSKIIKKKEQINATVSPWIKMRCLEMAESPEFSSLSDIVSQALSEFIAKYDERKIKETKKHEEYVPEILIYALMQTKSGQDLLESINKSNKNFFVKGEESENLESTKLRELIKTICESNVKNPSTG